ncbi:hypothetical protein JXL19_05270 [bacterium]|nr:hypothetical protein [bacterium]
MFRQHKTYSFLDSKAIAGAGSVAVLPFNNLTMNANAGVIITNMLMTELVRQGRFRVIKYGDLRRFFLDRRKTSVSSIDIETLRELRQKFRAEIAVIGAVLRYEDVENVGALNKTGGGKEPVFPCIYVSITILDTRSGRILGQGEFMEKGSLAGHLLSDKERQSAFALAQKMAVKMASAMGADRS